MNGNTATLLKPNNAPYIIDISKNPNRVTTTFITTVQRIYISIHSIKNILKVGNSTVGLLAATV